MTAPHSAPDPPLDTALLADLDAGLVEEPRATELRRAAALDPHATAVLRALAGVRAQLADLPDPPVPPAVAARWSAALRAELSTERADGSAVAVDPAVEAGSNPAAEPSAPPVPRPLAPPDRRRAPRPAVRRRAGGRPGRRSGALVAVLVLAASVGAGWLFARPAPSTPVVERPQLVALGRSTIGVRDPGGLDDATRRSACLRVVAPPGVDPTAPLLGGRRVTFADRPGVLLVLGTGRLGTFDVVVVDPACGPDAGTLLGATRVGP